jgi:hypothetical protein
MFILLQRCSSHGFDFYDIFFIVAFTYAAKLVPVSPLTTHRTIVLFPKHKQIFPSYDYVQLQLCLTLPYITPDTRHPTPNHTTSLTS